MSSAAGAGPGGHPAVAGGGDQVPEGEDDRRPRPGWTAVGANSARIDGPGHPDRGGGQAHADVGRPSSAAAMRRDRARRRPGVRRRVGMTDPGAIRTPRRADAGSAAVGTEAGGGRPGARRTGSARWPGPSAGCGVSRTRRRRAGPLELDVDDLGVRHLGQSCWANVRASSTGASVSLSPCTTRNGGASAWIWSSGDAAAEPLGLLVEEGLDHAAARRSSSWNSGGMVSLRLVKS